MKSQTRRLSINMKLRLNTSAKIHRRYLLIAASSKEMIEKILLDYLGVLGYSKVAPLFLTDKKGKNLILAVNRTELNNVRAAFELCKEKIVIIKVSGTLAGLSR